MLRKVTLFLFLILSPQVFAAENINKKVGQFIDYEEKFKEPNQNIFKYFKQNDSTLVRFPHSNTHQWISLKIKNNETKSLEKIIAFDYSLTGKLTLYQYKNGNFEKLGVSGSDIPALKRQNPSHLSSFRISLWPNEEAQFLIKRETTSMMDTSITAYSEKEFYQFESRDKTWITFYLGAILSLILYNFFVFVNTRQKLYLKYVIFSFSIALAILLVNNGYDFLLSDLIPLKTSIHIPFFGALMIISAYQFGVYFLGEENIPPLMLNFIKGNYYILGSIILLNFFPFYVHISPYINYLVDTTTMLLVASMIYSSWYAHQRGHDLARFYLVSWLFLLLSATAWYSVYFGIKLETLPTKAYMLMGNLIEMSIIALTSTYKIANLDKIEAEALAAKKEKDRYRTLLRALIHDLGNHVTNLYNYSIALFDHSLASTTTQNYKNRVDQSFENIRA